MKAELQHEQQMIRRMLRGEEPAFNEFFDEYFARLYRFVLPRLNGETSSAEEVAQTTMIKAMEKLDSFRGEARVFTWLCQIGRRQVADFLRGSQRRSDRVVLIDDSPGVRAALDAIAAPDDEPEVSYARDETQHLLQSILDRLPARYGDALEWKYVEGLSVGEISERLGIGQTATQSLLARARTAFKEAVETVFGAGELAQLLGKATAERH